MWLNVLWEIVRTHVKLRAKGYREALSAILIALVVGFLLGTLTGCGVVQELEHQARYEHQSSVPLFYDVNTIDHLGYCMVAKLGQDATCGRFCPKMEGCLNWEIHGQSVLGENPGGELSVRLPFALQKFE